MGGLERYALTGAGVLLALFVANIALGAAKAGVFLGDVGEMLVLFGASVLFVAAILRMERIQRGPQDSIEKDQ